MPTPTEELVATISERLKASGDVKVVFGEPQIIEGKTIVSVAYVAYGFGGGSGPQGQGGGGGLRVKPLGVLEITGERTRFVPIVDANRLAMLGIIGLALVLFWFRRPFRRR
jgi:uncharacterized spore protein YtfJ